MCADCMIIAKDIVLVSNLNLMKELDWFCLKEETVNKCKGVSETRTATELHQWLQVPLPRSFKPSPIHDNFGSLRSFNSTAEYDTEENCRYRCLSYTGEGNMGKESFKT